MANYYYVKNGGEASASKVPYSAKETGDFATLGVANYYPNIAAAIAASNPAPAGGDFILVSDLHDYAQASMITLTGIPVTPFYIVCVSDIAIDAGRRAGNRGVERHSADASMTFYDLYASGMEFFATDDIYIRGGNFFSDCKLRVDGSGDLAVNINQDGTSIFLEHCELALNNVLARMIIGNGAVMNMFGGAVTTTSAGINRLTYAGFISAGGHIRFSGVDLTAVTGVLHAVVGDSASTDDIIDTSFDMCKLATGVAFTDEDFKSKDQRALFTRCSDDSTKAEHQYHLHTFGGDVDDDKIIRRADDPAFEDSGTTISYKIDTNATDASVGSPLWFEFPNARWAALSTATDKLRFYIASTSALTDKDIYISISYPDGSNKRLANFITSAPTNIGGTIDLMAAGTTLSTDSGSDWRDGAGALTGHNEYVIEIDTSGAAGGDTVPIVRVYVTKPDVIIQLASIYDVI